MLIYPVREKAFGIPYWLLKLSHTSRIWLLYVAGCLLASYAWEDISTRDIFLSLSASPGIVTICCVSLFAICMANICFLFQLRWTYPISLDQT